MEYAMLRARAHFLQQIRHFFETREVIEVDTPLLYPGVATDPCLEAFLVEGRYLQTSPEFAMKRLLAEGSGPIYYLGKAFRKNEKGSHHNPEFTILEWYRPGWDHWQLIDEVASLFSMLLKAPPAKQITYAQLFHDHLGVDPHLATEERLRALAIERGWGGNEPIHSDRDHWLDLLMSHGIEPHIGHTEPLVVIDYPASQASLAKTRDVATPSPHAVAERFEFYYRGLELANGYHELLCADTLEARFQTDLAKRRRLGAVPLPIDHDLLAAMRKGLPPCAGVAVGVDRLLMIQQGVRSIREVLAFT